MGRELFEDPALDAGFTRVKITPAAHAGGGLASAVIQAVRPAAPDGVLIRPMRPGDAWRCTAMWRSAPRPGRCSAGSPRRRVAGLRPARVPLEY